METQVTEQAPVEATTAIETSSQQAPVAETPKFTNEQIFEMFKGSLGDELKGHSYLSKYKTAEDFAKAGINHQSALTKKASEYFASEDPVVVAERNKVLGVPEAPDAYKIDEQLESMVSKESVAAFKAKAHEMGLPQKYVNDLIKFETELWTKHAENTAAQAVAQKEATTKELQSVWKGDTFDHNTKQVTNLLTSELGLTAEDFNVPLGNNAKLIKALFEKVVPLYGPDKLIEGTMTQSRVSASERMKQLNVEMFNTPSGTPEYKKLLDEKTSLMSKIK